MSKFNFFNTMPLEILAEMYSFLPGSDLYNHCRLLDKKHRIVAEITLLLKKDQPAVEFQQKLIRKFSSKEAFKYRTQDDLQLIHSALFKSLKNPFFKLETKLNILMILCGLKNEGSLIGNEFLVKLNTSLANSNWDDYFQYLFCLNAFLPQMQPDLLRQSITDALNALDNQNVVIYQKAVISLTFLAPKLSRNDLMLLISKVITKLEDDDIKTRKIVINCLVACAPRLEKQQLIEVINKITTKLASPVVSDSQRALHSLASIISQLDTTIATTLLYDISTQPVKTGYLATFTFLTPFTSLFKSEDPKSLFEQILTKVKDNNVTIIRNSLLCLAAISSHLKNEDIVTNLSLVTKNIYHADLYVHKAALECLAGFLPRLSENTLINLIDEAIKKLIEADNWTAYKETIMCLTALKPKINLERLLILLKDINFKLDSDDPNLCQAAIAFLNDLVPQLPLSLIPINELTTKLKHSDWRIRKETLMCLLTLIPNIGTSEVSEVAELTDNIIKMVSDPVRNVRHSALECLTIIIPYLNIDKLQFLFPQIEQQLNNGDIEPALLNCLAAFAPKLIETKKEEEFKRIYELMISNLDNASKNIRATALNCLYSFIPYLNDEEVINLLEKVQTKLNRHDETSCRRFYTLAFDAICQRSLTISKHKLKIDFLIEFCSNSFSKILGSEETLNFNPTN